MSRIGRLPVVVPPKIEVEIQDTLIRITGPKGKLEHTFPADITVIQEEGRILIQRPSDSAQHRSLHGTTRALIQNMVTGLGTGFTKTLEIDGVGYRAEMSGTNLVLYVGYSHPVEFKPPEGISFDVDTRSRQVKVMGYDREQVGQTASDIRKVRPPEPYKGKGLHYLGERLKRKAGKAGKAKKK